MITAKIEVTWGGDDDCIPNESFFMDFETLPNIGDRVRLCGEAQDKVNALAKSHNISPGACICYVRRFVNDGGAKPIIRLGPDPRKLHLFVYRDPSASGDTEYQHVHYFVSPGGLPRRGDQIRVISTTKAGEKYDKWLYVQSISFDKWERIHVTTSVKRVIPIVEASIPETVNANIRNTVSTQIESTVYIDTDRPLSVEVENRHPIEVEVSNRCLYVENYDRYGD